MAASQRLHGAYLSADALVYLVEKTGTSGAVKPTSRAAYIIDNSVFLSFMGELVAVAYGNSLVMVLGQRFYANAQEYVVTVAGTTAAAGSGPATAAGGTDGTVSYSYGGPQTRPVLSFSAAAPAGTTAQAGYNSAKVTILSGVAVDDVGNGRREVRNVSSNGVGASGIGGKFAFRSDAPLLGFYYYDKLRGNVWVEGELVAAVDDTIVALSFCNFDFTGLPRKQRDFVIEVTAGAKFIAVYATAFDSVAAYIPDSAARAVLLGDSFAEARALALSYPLPLQVMP